MYLSFIGTYSEGGGRNLLSTGHQIEISSLLADATHPCTGNELRTGSNLMDPIKCLVWDGPRGVFFLATNNQH